MPENAKTLWTYSLHIFWPKYCHFFLHEKDNTCKEIPTKINVTNFKVQKKNWQSNSCLDKETTWYPASECLKFNTSIGFSHIWSILPPDLTIGCYCFAFFHNKVPLTAFKLVFSETYQLVPQFRSTKDLKITSYVSRIMPARSLFIGL